MEGCVLVHAEKHNITVISSEVSEMSEIEKSLMCIYNTRLSYFALTLCIWGQRQDDSMQE